MKARSKENYRILNRDAIKYIAAFTMLLNHIALIWMRPESFVANIFENIGYFTAITMCYFLVEGFYCTRSRKRYAFRLFLFGVISQIPYDLAIVKWAPEGTARLNMMFTLLICFLILLALEVISNEILLVLTIGGLLGLSVFCDWSLLAPGFTLLFWWAYGLKRETKTAFAISAVLLGLFHLSGGILSALGSMAGGALSGVVIVCLYNGKRAEKGKKFSKWFFYWFYPLHLLILGILRIAGEQGRI